MSLDPQNEPVYNEEHESFVVSLNQGEVSTRVDLLSLQTNTGLTSNVQQSIPVSSAGGGMAWSHLPWLTSLTFSGKVEEWPEFRRNFQARYKKADDDVAIQYL